MKKKNFVTMIMATIGGILFALGMCMALLPEWNAGRAGIVLGVLGAVILIAMVIVRRKMSGKPAIVLNGRAIGITALGIVGALVLGLGMCCVLEWSNKFFILGIILGLTGIALLAAAYPLHNFLIKKKREKLAPYILKLTDELSDM